MRGLRNPPTVVRGGPHSGISIRGTAGLTLIAALCRIGKYGRCRNEKYIFFSTCPSQFFRLEAETYNIKHWFALKVFYNKVFDIGDALKEDGIETYIPCEETLVERAGVRKKVRRPLISSLMFFRSTVRQATEVQRVLTDKAILYTRQEGLKKIPFAIPEREMNIFMLVTSSGERGMEYLGEDSPKFHRTQPRAGHRREIQGRGGCHLPHREGQPPGGRHPGRVRRRHLLHPAGLPATARRR